MNISRLFTKAGTNVYDLFTYTKRSSTLRNPDGSVVFEMQDIEVPEHWSQMATDILAQKYFRKAGVPQFDAEGNQLFNESGEPILGAETTARQVVHRLAGCWRHWGEEHDYFDSAEDAQAFYDEIAYMLMNQMCAPNSPQWFNTGLNWAYGITGPAQGHYYVDPESGKLTRSKDAYTHPAPHACFIQSVADDLVNEGGIFDLVTREARIFKYGSGTGSNFSSLRGEGEPLSGGGVSSGLMSFLKINDRAAGAVKSGGTTRRAAKMVILNADHPDIEKFIDWKMIEEQKVAAMVAGSKVCSTFLEAISEEARISGTDFSDPESELHSLVQRAISRGIPFNYIARVLALVDQGVENIDFREYDLHYEGEAYNTVSGQNSNNSIRLSNEFMKRVKEDSDWGLISRTNGQTIRTVKARYLWGKINYAAWSSADPGVQYDTTINEWHTSPKEGRINGSNPCSEYLYLDDTACVAPETRISTPEGLRTVEELFAIQETGKRVMITTDIHSEQDHRRLTAHRPAYITKVGEKQTYRIETKDGRVIRATEEHRFLTDDGNWKRVDQLEVGSDRIEIRESGNTISYTSSDDDVRRFQALGWLTGDGVFSKGSVAMVFGPQEEKTGRAMEVEFNRLLDDSYRWIWNEENVNDSLEEGGSEGILRDPHLEYSWTVGDSGAMVAEPYVTSRGVTLGQQASGVYQMTSQSTALVRYLEEVYGCTQGTAIYKNVPKGVFTAPDDLKAAYLGGLFSADGCLRDSATEKEVMLASSSKELLRSVQLLLSDLGIVGRISWMHPTGRKNPQGQLHLHNQQARKFLALIGFPCSESKNAEAQKIRSTEFSANRRNPRPVTVVSIERDEVTTVYDITEPVTRSFIAEGMITHNCNLASLNLSHFYNTETEVFDVEAFKHASRLWTVVLEISVLMAQFPSKVIAQKSFETRTLGLGYANLGTVLMTAGIPYDSDEGRNWASAITAVMTGEAYATSAELARDKGAFAKYQRNAKDMLRVIRNHRRAAYNAPEGEYEGLTVTPVGLESDLCPANLATAAKETWDRALELGETYGYRNAQVTVIAPTGTISLVMDCDTTGIEPDFALVKYKKLAGGGYFKIVNQSVPKALKKLGYTDAEIADITGYIRGYASLRNAPHINRESLKAKGFTDEKVDAIESQLDTVFDIAFAFNHHTLGEEFLELLGFPPAVSTAPNFNLLEALGFTKDELLAANRHVCGTMTIEGAPGLREEHLPIFDCANRCGKDGKRFIQYMGHVKMMAAAQPFISGAISKTINMPREATLEDVERVYMESWRLMVKAIALYRDGSKLSQPLNVSSDLELVEEVTLRDVDLDAVAMIGNENDWNENISPALVQEKIVERVYHRTERRRLPKRRHGFVREANVGGHKVFLRTGEYEDGSIGEIFIDMYKEGASFKGLLNCFAVLASKALQYGMPLEKMVDTFTFTRFEPAGAVQGHEAIKNATSIIDYVFRAIGYEYLGREDFVHVKAVDETEGIEYESDEEGGDTPTGKLSPGQELWERQKTHRRQIRKGGGKNGGGNGGTSSGKSGGTHSNGNGNSGGHANGSAPSVGAKIAAARSVSKEVTFSEAEAKVATAKAHGYTGEQCGNCGSMRVKQNGACHVCEECGTTSGCS